MRRTGSFAGMKRDYGAPQDLSKNALEQFNKKTQKQFKTKEQEVDEALQDGLDYQQ